MMRTLIKAATVATALLAATPVLAWTAQAAAPLGASSPHFSDPDEALESAGSNLRDSVVSSSLSAGGGAAFTGASTRYGDQGYGFSPSTATSQAYEGAAAYGFGPSPSGGDLSPSQVSAPRRR